MEDVAVTAVRTVPYNAIQVGIENRREKRTHNALLGQFRKNGVKPKMRMAEFKVTDDALLQPGMYISSLIRSCPADWPTIGTELSAAHFVPGQYVDVQGRRSVASRYSRPYCPDCLQIASGRASKVR